MKLAPSEWVIAGGIKAVDMRWMYLEISNGDFLSSDGHFLLGYQKHCKA